MSASIPALIAVGGVAVGALLQFVASIAVERSKWARSHGVRWDERRLTAYSDYATAVKRLVDINQRIARTKGLASNSFPADVTTALKVLDEAEADRGLKWESVLLLGSPAVIRAARAWQETVWELYRFSTDDRSDAADFKAVLGRAGEMRNSFYEQARVDLKVPDSLPRSSWLSNYFRREQELKSD